MILKPGELHLFSQSPASPVFFDFIVGSLCMASTFSVHEAQYHESKDLPCTASPWNWACHSASLPESRSGMLLRLPITFTPAEQTIAFQSSNNDAQWEVLIPWSNSSTFKLISFQTESRWYLLKVSTILCNNLSKTCAVSPFIMMVGWVTNCPSGFSRKLLNWPELYYKL